MLQAINSKSNHEHSKILNGFSFLKERIMTKGYDSFKIIDNFNFLFILTES